MTLPKNNLPKEVFYPVLKFFLDSLEERLNGIRQALSSNNTGELKRLVHQLKGSAVCFGYTDISYQASAFEKKIQNGIDEQSCLQDYEKLALLCHEAIFSFANRHS